MAAVKDGYGVDLDFFLEGSVPLAVSNRPIARGVFGPGEGTPEPLFAYVRQRRSMIQPELYPRNQWRLWKAQSQTVVCRAVQWIRKTSRISET